MKCPQCKAWALVLETRKRPDGSKRRRYKCANDHRFSTYVDEQEFIKTEKLSPVDAPTSSDLLAVPTIPDPGARTGEATPTSPEDKRA